MRILLFLFVALLVNLPYAQERWIDHRIAAEGVDVEAPVIGTRQLGDGYVVDYRLPGDLDPSGTAFSAAVDAETYRVAEASDLVAVRVLLEDPSTNRPLGLVPSSLFAVIAVAADVVLLMIAAGFWWRRRQRHVSAS